MQEFCLNQAVSRLKLGISVGLSDHQIMKHEMRQDDVSSSIFWKICSVLRCPADSLFILPDAGPIDSEPLENESVLLDDRAVLAAFQRITPPEVRRRVACLILTLAAQSTAAEADGSAARGYRA